MSNAKTVTGVEPGPCLVPTRPNSLNRVTKINCAASAPVNAACMRNPHRPAFLDGGTVYAKFFYARVHIKGSLWCRKTYLKKTLKWSK